MATLPALDSSIDLRAVTVRPTWGAREHRRWDRWVEEHHYLAFHGVIGKGLRHVAVLGETWLALLGWQPGAFKLGARDRWIGWSAPQQFRRLHLIANNSRFVILTPERVPNLASRRLPGGERIRPVRRPAVPGAAQGGGRLLEPLQATLHPARDHHLPQRPCRLAGGDPGQRPSASGPASTAAHTRPSPWTARTCAAPRSRPNTGAG